MKKRKTTHHPSEEAMFRNPPASVNDATGFVQEVPYTESEAENYSNLFDVPVSENEKKTKKSRFNTSQR